MEGLIAQAQVENIEKSQAPAHDKTESPGQKGRERLNFLSNSPLHPIYTGPPSLQGPHAV